MRKKTLKLLAVIIQTSPERLWELQECNSTPPERFSHQPFYCSHWAKMWFWLLLPRDAPSTDFSHVGKCVLIPNHFNLSVSWRRQILIRVRFCQRCWAAWQSAGKAWKACTGRRKKAAAGVSNAMKCLPAIWKSQIKSFATNLSRDFVCRQKSSPLLPAQTSFPKQGLSMWHRWFQLLLLEAVDPGTTRLRLKLLGYCKYRYWALCISMPFLYIFILFTSLYHLALFPTGLGQFSIALEAKAQHAINRSPLHKAVGQSQMYPLYFCVVIPFAPQLHG